MKKKTRTPEEQLAAAQVPEASWPYALPEGWTWVRLGGIAELAKEKTDVFRSEDKYVGLEHIEKNGAGKITYSNTSELKSTKNIFHAGEILYGKLRPYLNKHGIVNFDGICSTDILVFRPTNMVDVDWLNWYFDNGFFIQYAVANSKGINLPRVSAKDILQARFPLPPINEQKSIVRRIESLFQKLDEAEEKIEAARASFETRRAALLHQAFAGELTAEWRKNHGNISWEDCTVKNVCDDIKVGIVIKPTQYYTAPENGTPAFRSANVREFRVDFSEWVYINEIGKKENARTIVHEGDVLVVRSGNPGTACVVPKKCDGYGAIDILIAVPNTKKIMSEFLCAYTNSPYAKDFVAKNKRGIALPHFNVKGYGSTPIKLPPLDEQQEIVRRLDHLLACEGRAAEAVEVAEAQLRKLRASILARAFRGRL